MSMEGRKLRTEKISENEIKTLFQKVDESEISENENLFLTTLYLSEQGSKLSLENERFIISKNDVIMFTVPCLKITQITIFGNINLTSQVASYCFEKNIPVIYLTVYGNYKGRLQTDGYKEVKNIETQFIYFSNGKKRLRTSKAFICGKLRNYVSFIREVYPQYYKEAENIFDYSEKLYKSKTVDEIRGYEGAASAAYFSVVKKEFEHFGFSKRVKRPPTDMINSLLSFGYTILYSNVISVLIINNLNPYIGVFHSMSSGHAALASDLMEEFRAYAVDRVILKAIKDNEFTTNDFLIADNKAYYLKQDAKKKFIGMLEKNMSEMFVHPETGYRVTLKRLIDLQAKRLFRVLSGEEKEYIPMLFDGKINRKDKKNLEN